ncbi:hypothetical protein [Streptomyces sp. UG1]|uniref:hypothetical protein n=1 Tax=Streptomyces sp. UG1 TaxID=3417652 RepID=UPI003CEC2EAE
MAATRTLAETVFVTDPKNHETLLLAAGTTVTDPVLAAQITHPEAWMPEAARVPEAQPPRAPRRTKAVTETDAP